MHHLTLARLSRGRLWGFTLIELLIVVTIIAILAAIAVPNFLEAQTRSKVSRIKADMRTMATAIETYRLDNNDYPYRRSQRPNAATANPATAEVTKRAQFLKQLTTPIGYITSLPPDLFDKTVVFPNNSIEYYDPQQTSWLLNATHPRATQPERRVADKGAGWMLLSVGPDGYLGSVDTACDCSLGPPGQTSIYRGTLYYVYDPTNGTISFGNIYHSSFYGMENGAALTRQFYAGNLGP
jgi:type II secretion system protein G